MWGMLPTHPTSSNLAKTLENCPGPHVAGIFPAPAEQFSHPHFCLARGPDGPWIRFKRRLHAPRGRLASFSEYVRASIRQFVLVEGVIYPRNGVHRVERPLNSG